MKQMEKVRAQIESGDFKVPYEAGT
jgi:hypothetical protein